MLLLYLGVFQEPKPKLIRNYIKFNNTNRAKTKIKSKAVLTEKKITKKD